MPHNRVSQDHQRLSALFARRGVLTSADIQTALGISQASVSRLVKTIPDVVKVGKARASRYAMVQTVVSKVVQSEQNSKSFALQAANYLNSCVKGSLFWTQSNGLAVTWGQYYLTVVNQLVLASMSGKIWIVNDHLPWFMAVLRLEGYIGRQLGEFLNIGNPERWTLAQQLAVCERLSASAPRYGAISTAVDIMTDSAFANINWLTSNPTLRLNAYGDEAANNQLNPKRASSAGGEQPKFERTLENGEHLIVKYSPPRDTPFGERWHDLLCAEHLALETLAKHGVPVAKTSFLASERRSYLEVVRFDKIAIEGGIRQGSRHIVPLHAIHAEFVGGSQQDWARSCNELVKQKRLPAADANRVQALLVFGHMIANTDMHFGNLSLFVDSIDDLVKGRFTLAPCYDMLPMRYRPDGGVVFDANYAPFNPFAMHDVLRSYGVSESTLMQVHRWALDFWQTASLDARLSTGFRQLALATVNRLTHHAD